MQNSIILILSVWIGAFLGYFFRKYKNTIATYLLVFSGGFLLSITVLEIFPSIYLSNPSIGGWVLVGVILQILLEFLTKGAEHGHVHHSHEKEESVFPLSLLIGLFIHSFIEGIPIGSDEIAHAGHAHSHENLLWGIFVHNIPVAFLLSFYLFNSHLKPIYAVLLLFLFSIAAPLGSLLGSSISEPYYDRALALVGGIFLHISSLIIFESNKKHSFNFLKLIMIILGMLLAYFIV